MSPYSLDAGHQGDAAAAVQGQTEDEQDQGTVDMFFLMHAIDHSFAAKFRQSGLKITFLPAGFPKTEASYLQDGAHCTGIRREPAMKIVLIAPESCHSALAAAWIALAYTVC